MKKVFKELKDFKKHIFILLALIMINVLSNLFVPTLLADVINDAIPKGSKMEVFIIGLEMLVIGFVGLVAAIAAGYFSSTISVGVARNIRKKVFYKVQEFSEKEFDEISVSSLITRTNNDVIQVQTFLNFLFRISLMAPIMAIGGVFMALQKSVELSLVVLASAPIMIVFILYIGRKTIPISTEMQERLDDMNMVVREKLTGIRVARTFGTEEYEEKRFRLVNEAFRERAEALYNLMIVLFPGLHVILYGTTVAIMIFGGYSIVGGSGLLVGDVIAVIQYVGLIMMSVVLLSVMFLIYPRASVSMGRINQVLDMNISIENNPRPLRKCSSLDDDAELRFENVSFSFEGATKKALDDISFSLKTGEVTAIIGSTGSGKSTIANLIPRFFDVTEGRITLEGVDIRDWDLHSLRSLIGIVPQKAVLFKGTILSNVSWGSENISIEDVNKAIEIAQAKDFVGASEEKLEKEVSQGGANLSGGQRQRLSIARAVARKPKIYIFDDSFSALDFKTDSKLRKALYENTKDAAVLMIAQRVSTIKNADNIIVIEGGKVVGQGTHEYLLENCHVYEEIVQSQYREEELANE